MPDVRAETQGAARIIRFDNPPRGYMTAAGAGLLAAQVVDAAADAAVRAIILTGVGDVFVRHYDVAEIVAAGEALATGAISADAFETGPFIDLLTAVSEAPKPVIAAINGVCMGGGFELALACDLRIAGAAVHEIGLPEVRVGIFPGWGGTQRLPRLIGEAAALDFILRGRVVTAAEAADDHLVHEAVLNPLGRALEIAEEIASRGAEGVAAAKRLIRSAADKPLADGLQAERYAFQNVLRTDTAMSAMRAFLKGDGDITH